MEKIRITESEVLEVLPADYHPVSIVDQCLHHLGANSRPTAALMTGLSVHTWDNAAKGVSAPALAKVVAATLNIPPFRSTDLETIAEKLRENSGRDLD